MIRFILPLFLVAPALAGEPSTPGMPMTPKMHWSPRPGDPAVVWNDGGAPQIAVADRLLCERLANVAGDEIEDVGKDKRAVLLDNGTPVAIVRRHFRETGFAKTPAVEVRVADGEHKGKHLWMLERSVAQLVPARFSEGDEVVIGRPSSKAPVWVSKSDEVAHSVFHAIRTNQSDRYQVEFLAMNDRIFMVSKGTPAKVVRCWQEIALVNVTDGAQAGADIWVDVRYLSPAKK